MACEVKAGDKPNEWSLPITPALIAKILVGVVVAWLVFGNVLQWVCFRDASDDWTRDFSRAGQYGDAFGMVNSLFTALAFAGVALAMLYQAEQVRLQREQTGLIEKQLELQRQEIADGKADRKNDEAIAKKQTDAMLVSTYLSALGSVMGVHERWATSEGVQPHKLELYRSMMAETEVLLFSLRPALDEHIPPNARTWAVLDMLYRELNDGLTVFDRLATSTQLNYTNALEALSEVKSRVDAMEHALHDKRQKPKFFLKAKELIDKSDASLKRATNSAGGSATVAKQIKSVKDGFEGLVKEMSDWADTL